MTDFTKFFLGITRDEYRRRHSGGHYDAPGANISIQNIHPDFSIIMRLVERVGGPYGWPLRPKFTLAERPAMERRLNRPDAQLMLLKDDRVIVGFCWILQIQDKVESYLEKLLPPGQETYRAIEIEHYGFFPEFTGKGYGRIFLPMIFERLTPVYDIVYLSTRSTNHKRVVPFYESLGMTVIGREVLPDDLIAAEEKIVVKRYGT